MSRTPEPRIVDPATHPRRYVNLTVAAAYLEMSRSTLYACIAEGLLKVHRRGRVDKVALEDLVAFDRDVSRGTQMS